MRSSSSTPQLKQGQLEQVASDRVQLDFEYLKGWRLHNHSGQPLPVVGHPHSKKVLPDVQTDPSVFQFVPSLNGATLLLEGKEAFGH